MRGMPPCSPSLLHSYTCTEFMGGGLPYLRPSQLGHRVVYSYEEEEWG